MRNWLGYYFESSTRKTSEFKAFARDFKKALKKELPNYIIKFNVGHFDIYCFAYNSFTGNNVYISISDVRFFRDDWYNNILIRKVINDKDYTGGMNHYTTFPEIKEMADRLTEKNING